MNKIFRSKKSTREMSLLSIHTFIAKATESSEWFEPSRIEGKLCECEPNKGEFVLDRIDSLANREGGKLYMKCRICQSYSHL